MKPPMTSLRAEHLQVSYGPHVVINDLTLSIPPGGFTAIIGPNGCGKTTLLRTLGRMIRPQNGRVLIDNTDIARLKVKQLARMVGLLAQSPLTPASITVADLVARGRNPHQSLLRQWSDRDEQAVTDALAVVGLSDQADRLVEELSGGQRQRAWIAMVLAQHTPILLLDEPTTYLDIVHQVEVLNLLSGLLTTQRTLVAVLHDLNLAARYATHIVAMCAGEIIAEGPPEKVFTSELLLKVFDLAALVLTDPETGRPLIVPRDLRQDKNNLSSGKNSSHPRSLQK